MDILTLLFVLSAFFAASFLKGLTGLGFSTLCLGILAVFLDLKVAIPLVFLPSLSSNFLVMVDAGRFFEALKRFWLLYLSAVPGLIFGILVLGGSDNGIPRLVLGAVMIVYGTIGLLKGTFSVSSKYEKLLGVPVGIVSGLVNGMTGSQIMPIMPYLLALKMDRDLFIQTINCAFTINTLIMVLGLSKLGLITKPVVFTSAAGVLPVWLGIYMGGKIRKKVTEEIYRKMVLVLLLCLGISLIIKSV